jgi:hypothetical protein
MTDTLVPICGLYQNESTKTGRPYFVGYMGRAKILLLEDTRAEPGQPGWTLFITERPQKASGTTTTRPTSQRTSSRARQAAADAGRPFDDRLDDIR